MLKLKTHFKYFVVGLNFYQEEERFSVSMLLLPSCLPICEVARGGQTHLFCKKHSIFPSLVSNHLQVELY